MRLPRCLPLLLAVWTWPLPAQRMKLLVPMDSLIERARRDSNDAPANYEVGLAYWFDRKYDQAERHLRRAIAIEPKTAPAYLALSYLPYARRAQLWDEEDAGKVPDAWRAPLEEAWRFRRQAFLLDPLVELKPLALSIPPASALRLSRGRQEFYVWLANGFGALWDGQYEKAYGFLRQIAGSFAGRTVSQVTDEDRQEKFPNWLLWYEALAAAHTRNFDQALVDVRILMVRADTASREETNASLAFSRANHYRYTMACLLDQAGRSREAVPLLKEVLGNDIGFYMANVRLAEIYESIKKPQSALEERRRAVAANPDDPSLLSDLGQALARAGELVEARDALQQAAAANPLNVRTFYLLGQLEERLGHPPEARQAYIRFLALAPSRFADQRIEVERKLQTLAPEGS